MRKRTFSVLLLIGALSFATSACSTTNKESHTLANVEKSISKYTKSVDHSFAYDIAHTLSYDQKLLSNKMGWRTAGSDAEHAASDYLENKMKEIGLSNVEKVAVPVDKWQFNDASLTIAGTDINIMPASYATNGTDKDGITAEIVDVGFGGAKDYKDVDVNGKIVLCGVDQWNEVWIDSHMEEAAKHGAVAIISYAADGYARYSDDMINMQDVCARDLMPCVSISKNQYKEIAKAIQAGNTQATLCVDNVMLDDQGTSYNVIGKIPGKTSDQQIIVSAHYDCYFWGFQDDNCAVGLVLEMANAMLKSGLQPQNDIVFVCHGAEEWGATDTDFDYTMGAWEMINHAHPEWASKTIAMLNFELPAYYDGAQQAQIACVPEFASLVSSFVQNEKLCPAPSNNIYPKGINKQSAEVSTMEDGVSYRMAGVPYMLPAGVSAPGEGGPGWYQQCYHTPADNKDSYSKDVMITNLNMYGAMAIYLDAMPALQLDFTTTVNYLDEFLDRDIAKQANVDITAYEQALSTLSKATKKHQDKINDINKRYIELVKNNASEQELAKLYEEGRALNKQTLTCFKFIQDHFSNIVTASDIVPFHSAYQDNIQTLTAVINALKEGTLYNDDETGALDLAWHINNDYDYCFYHFSLDTVQASMATYKNEDNLFWGTNKGFEFANTGAATISLLEKSETNTTDFTNEIKIYEQELQKQTSLYQQAANKDIPAMKKLVNLLK